MVTPEELHEVISHNLFGNAFLLETAAAIARFSDGRFTLTEVARAAQLEKNVVKTALVKLLAAGWIKKLPRDGQRQPYERIDSAYWKMCRTLLREVRGE